MNFYDIADGFESLRDKADSHSYIYIADNESMRIECCKGVLVMNENLIKLRLARCSVTITGLGLSMKNYSREGVSISGSFHSVDFEPVSEKISERKRK